jgi:hypothetical protein
MNNANGLEGFLQRAYTQTTPPSSLENTAAAAWDLEKSRIEFADKKDERKMKDKREERYIVAFLFIMTFISGCVLSKISSQDAASIAFSIAGTMGGFFAGRQISK